MKKKIALAVAIVACLICLFAISVNAQEPSVTVGGVTYEFGDVTLIDGITAPEGKDTESRVLMSDGKTYPAYYFVGTGYSIYRNSFVWTKAMKDDGSAYTLNDIIMLEIPSHITEMSNDAPLADANSVVYVSMPSITSWANEAHFSGLDSLVVMDLSRATKTTYLTRGFLMNCSNLTTVIWPEESSIASIGRGAFTGCTSLTSIALPEGVKSIGEESHNNPGVFQGCSALVSVTLPDSLTFIGKKDFLNCTALTSIEIPSSVSKIHREAFQNCSSLVSITSREVEGKTAQNLYIGEDNFVGCTSLSSVTFIQDTVTVAAQAFYNCKNVDINIKALSGSVGKKAFYSCDKLSVTDMTGVTYINQQAFYDCKSLVNVQFSSSLATVMAEAFRGCTNLVFVDFGMGSNALNIAEHRTFYDCTSLLAVSLPSGITTLNNGTFGNCTSLRAVYLGESMIRINGNKGDGAGDGPTFCNCKNMYFVQNAFSVRKADGSFYTAEEFVQPEKPDVYFFPSTLKRVCGSHNINSSFVMDENGNVKNTGGGDLAFVNCTNLNKYLVFPEAFTGVDDSIYSGNNAIENDDQRGDTLGQGLFHGCATESNPLTLIFLGRIDRISFDRVQNYTNYMTYVFANSANTGFENTKIGSFIGNGDKYSGQKEMYVVFCHATGGAQRYSISFIPNEADKTIPVLNASLVEGDTHIANPRLPQTTLPANCVDNEMTVNFCFCGGIASKIEVEGTALGHEFNTENGAIDLGISYVDYFQAGVHKIDCGRCDHIEETEKEAIFTWKGYSASTFGEGYSVVQGFYVNQDAIKEYVVYAPDFNYGILATVNKTGEAITPKVGDDNVLSGNFIKDANDYLDIKVTGIPVGHEDTLVAFCVYVTVEEKIYYLDGDKTADSVVGISYNGVLALNN